MILRRSPKPQPNRIMKASQLYQFRNKASNYGYLKRKHGREGITAMKMRKEGHGLGEDPKLLGLVVHKEEREVD